MTPRVGLSSEPPVISVMSASTTPPESRKGASSFGHIGGNVAHLVSHIDPNIVVTVLVGLVYQQQGLAVIAKFSDDLLPATAISVMVGYTGQF